jgi:hypothetical protein
MNDNIDNLIARKNAPIQFRMTQNQKNPCGA